MQIWSTLLHVIQLLAALAMIGLVLIQHGKGADMGASFGSGASGSLFGASGSANFLSRSTAACAAIFFGCTLALAFMGTDLRSRAVESSGSVLDRAAPAASAPVVPVIPGLAPAASAPAAPTAPALPAAPAAPVTPATGGVPAPIAASAPK
jgi:preprotein translocase subunit SecG